MPEWSLWFLYILALSALVLLNMNEWRKWKKPLIYKGDTGPMGMAGMPGESGICKCYCCNTESEDLQFDCERLDKPMPRGTKEDLYNLPPVPDDK